MSKSARPSRRLRLLRWTVAVLLALTIVALIGPQLLAPYVRGKLQAMIASRVDAELRMSSLAYLPPFGVRVRDAQLIARDSDGREIDLLKIARLDLRLAKLPFGDGPLVIERIDVREPEIHLIATSNGIVGAHSFRVEQKPTTAPTPPMTKLSDMFDLRQITIHGGRIVLEDRTRPGSVPMVWTGINAESGTKPTSKSSYTFNLTAEHAGVAKLAAGGSFDLDELRVALAATDLTATADPTRSTSSLPSQIQSILQENKVAGKIHITGKADVPFKHLSDATFDTSLEITNASATIAKTGTPLSALSLKLQSSKAPGEAAPIDLRLNEFSATSNDARLMIGRNDKAAMLRIDRAKNAWTLTSLSGELVSAGKLTFSLAANGPLRPPAGQSMLQAADYRVNAKLAGVGFHPPGFPLPLDNVGGDAAEIELRRGVLVFKNISARYGTDDVLLRYARVPIPNDPVELKNASAIEEIDARVTFKQPGPEYPSAFGNVVAAIRPAGAFEVGGGSYFRFKSSEKPDWFFGVSTDAGAFTLTDKNVKITGITADATVSSDMVDIKRFDGSVLGGRIVASGKVTPKEPYVVESGTLSLSEIDLAQLARTVQPKKPNDKLVGRGTLNTTFAGGFESGALNGAGEFEIIEGHFWSLPVIGEIASKSAKGRGLTRGEAAGVFRLEGRKVMLENAAVSSSALGLIGSGAIDVDNQSLEFRVIAAPLGDWRDRIQQTKIPILSNIAGEIVGGVQRLVNSATSTLLYQFRVTGTIGQPKIETVPAPVLTDPAALLFGKMLDESRKAHTLLESIKRAKTPQK